MSKTTVTRIYSTYTEASRVVSELEAANVPHGDITLLSHSSEHSGLSSYDSTRVTASDPYETAMATGAVGGTFGLLAGLGLLAIPGVGAIAAVGWLGATLAGFTFGAAGGAAIAGIAESLTNHGVDSETAKRNAAAIEAGGTLVAVKCDSDRLGTIESIMGTNDGETDIDPVSTTTTRSVA